MALTTRTKIALASVLSRGVIASRRLLGKSPVGVFQRKGLSWELDLQEGIDFSIFLLGGFELKTRSFYKGYLKQGSVILDIGANIGAHALPLAETVGPEGKVYAFEATQFAVNKLRANVGLNRSLEKIIDIQHCLLTDGEEDSGEQQIHSSWPLMGSPRERHPEHGGLLKDIATDRSFSIDQFCEQRKLWKVDFIKLDVDGHEWPILNGMKQLIERSHPVILMELAPAYNKVGLAVLLKFFQDRDYELFTLSNRPLSWDTEQILKSIPKGGSINVYARHGVSPV